MSTYEVRPLYRRWLPIVLIVTAAANLVTDQSQPPISQSFRLHDSGSLTHLVHTEQPFLDRHYGIYLEMGEVMAQGTLVVPEGGPVGRAIDAHSARGLARVTVLERDYDAGDVPKEVIPNGPPAGVIEIGLDVMVYWILSGENDHRWWLAQIPEGIVLVPESLAEVPVTEA